MTATRRILAAVALASGVTGLTATAASAAPLPPQALEVPSVIGQLDALSAQSVGPEHQARMPTVTGQVGTVQQGLSQLGQLRQVTDLVAPVTGLLPAVQT
ncbi:hypothetical protein ACWD6I_07005 [Streptomyces sp. NPDC002454]|jgi:hypothetical protein|uniref:hypothetical protein n=1 Tax=unclassified Streptomyces TaxID=2593676 RepID=UPI00332E0469